MDVKERMEELALDTEDASERVAKARSFIRLFICKIVFSANCSDSGK